MTDKEIMQGYHKQVKALHEKVNLLWFKLEEQADLSDEIQTKRLHCAKDQIDEASGALQHALDLLRTDHLA